jgi:hypothetical protein
LNRLSGKLVWERDTAKEWNVPEAFFGVGSTPVIEGDLLIVQVGGSPPESKRAPPTRLDLIEGKLRLSLESGSLVVERIATDS